MSRRVLVGLSITALVALPLVASAQGSARVSVESPREGSTVTGPKVEVKLRFQNFTPIAAGTAVKAGEGHAHVFVDRDPIAAGQLIPTDQPNIVHMGAAPFDTRQLDLQPGRHTLTAVLGDSSHRALDVPNARASFTVAAAGQAPPRAADTGDGSLATQGVGVATIAVLAFGALAVAMRARRGL